MGVKNKPKYHFLKRLKNLFLNDHVPYKNLKFLMNMVVIDAIPHQ